MVTSLTRWFGPRNYDLFTVTIAAPGVITKISHHLGWGDQVIFKTTGALPTGLSTDTWYYVIPIDDETFSVTATSTGSAITTTGTQSGYHYLASDSRQIMTAKQVPYI